MNADDSARLRDLLANNRTLLAYIVIGFAQHRAVARQVEVPAGGSAASQLSYTAASAGCVLVCALLAVYLATNIK